jgi:hypothetical protein
MLFYPFDSCQQLKEDSLSLLPKIRVPSESGSRPGPGRPRAGPGQAQAECSRLILRRPGPGVETISRDSSHSIKVVDRIGISPRTPRARAGPPHRP